MDGLVKVAVDAMGGDNAPFEIVKGTVEAVQASEKLKCFLVGKEDVVKKELAAYTYDTARIEVINANDIITNDEAPVMAIRRKKESSIVVGLNLVKSGEADGFISAGSTGTSPHHLRIVSAESAG